jgi:hypothetical protein
MPFNGLPLLDRVRFQFDKTPTTRRVRECDQSLCGSPQASLALRPDGKRFKRSK